MCFIFLWELDFTFLFIINTLWQMTGAVANLLLPVRGCLGSRLLKGHFGGLKGRDARVCNTMTRFS